MKSIPIILLVATSALAQVPVARVADDAKVIDRVAEVAGKNIPADVVRRIVNEDIDLLRGRRSDASFQYAGFERMEAGRTSQSFSVEPRSNDDLMKLEIRGANVYRLVIESHERRMLVTKNRRVWIDRVDIESIPEGASASRVETIKVGAWLDPGATRPVDLKEVARSATARVYARADKEEGYGNVTLTFIEARIFDNPDSPYADAVQSERAILRALDHGDISSIRSMAGRIATELAPKAAAATVEVTAPPPIAPVATAPATLTELQNIEDLLTGSDNERRQGVDKLHQLIRRLRNQ